MGKPKEKAAEPTGAMRDMSETEIQDMHAGGPPEGYAKETITTELEPETPASDAPKAPETPAASAPVTPPAAPATPAAPAAPATPPVSADAFEKIETELAKPEGKEDLSAFSGREKAYFHQMRRDRKARQKAEADADVLRRENLKLKNPPPTPPDPLAGLGDDDVLTVKELKERLAKTPPAAPATQPAAPVVAPAQVRYLEMCERESRTAHPDDFDAVMELSDELISTDPAALKELSEKVSQGENPAELMYQAVKKHKDFENLFPAAQTRAKARLTAKAVPAAVPTTPPASPSAPAVTVTPAAQAKIDEAQRAQQALETNGNRTKTTAHGSSREDRPTGELNMEDIAKMSDLEFARLPKSVRNKYLEKYG